MPKIILIHGSMAVGKSTITEKLMKKLPNFAYVDRPYIKRGLKPLGRELAKKLSKEASYDIIKQIMKLKKNIIVQEVNIVSLRKKLKSYLKKYNYKIYAFHLTCSLKEAKKREKNRTKKSRSRLLEKITKEFPPPSKFEIIIDTEKLSVRQAVDYIIKKIK